MTIETKASFFYRGVSRCSVIFFLWLVGMLCGCMGTPGNLKHFSEVRLGLAPDMTISAIRSPDNRHIVFGSVKGAKKQVVIDGKPGPEFNEIARDSIVFSPDGSHTAFAAQKGKKAFVVVDNKSFGLAPPTTTFEGRQGGPGPEYDDIENNSIVFSPDGKRLAYGAAKGGKWMVVVDGMPGQEYENISGVTTVFSPDSRHVAYAAANGGKWQVFVDGRGGPQYDGIGQKHIIFSPDSKRLAYHVIRGDKHIIVVDDQPFGLAPPTTSFEGRQGGEGPEFGAIGVIIFSPDSVHIAYTGWKGAKVMVVLDGKPGPQYDGIEKSSPVFSPDGKRVAYWALKGDKHLVVVDGIAGPEYDTIKNGSPCFSPDSKHVAYAAIKDGRQMVIVDGVEQPAFDSILKGPVNFSPDGRRLVYGAKKGSSPRSPRGKAEGFAGEAGKWMVVVNSDPFDPAQSREGPEFEAIAAIALSPDSKRLAYAAKNGVSPRGEAGKWMVIVDDRPGPEYDGIAVLAFSPDGTRKAYIAKEGKKWLVVVDGRPGPQYDGIVEGTSIFSPDSSHVVYAAGANNKQFIVVDGQAGPEYDGILCGPAPTDKKEFEAIGYRDKMLYRVTWKP